METQIQSKDKWLQDNVSVDTDKELYKTPFFSVCIPTYNRASLLPQAIDSVLTQSFEDFELVICDNASTDNTEEVVNRYQDERIRYVRFDNLVSMYANHNRCIDLAKAKWLVFLHSDDNLEKDALSTIKFELDQFENLDILAPNFDYIETFRDIIQSDVGEAFLNKEASFLFCVMSFSPCGVCFNKNSFYKYGRFLEKEITIDKSSYCVWSDGVLEIEWLLQGAKISMSTKRWFFWSQGTQSSYVNMRKNVSFEKANFPIMDSFFSFHYRDNSNLKIFLDELVCFFSKTPDKLKVDLLKKCYQAGYAGEADYIDQSLSTFDGSYRKNYTYMTHVIPLKLSPTIYWFLLSLKKKIDHKRVFKSF